MSRLLQYLSSALARGGEQRELLHLKTRLAVHLARKGEVQTATETIADIRKTGAAGLLADATARANLAEGVALFCSGRSDLAGDKLRRAVALGDAAAQAQVSRWARSWLAHLELDNGHVGAVAPYARDLLATTPESEHWVLSRVGSTVASGLHLGDRFDLARPWFEFARQHAVAEGDDLTIDANLYNVAALRIHNLRLSEISSAIDSAETQRAEMELRSSFNYDAAKSPKSFRWAIPLIELQLSLLLDRNEFVAERLPKWLEAFREIAPPRHVVLALADHAYALTTQRESRRAFDTLAEAIRSVTADMAVDELALLKYRESQVSRALGDDSRAASSLKEAVVSLEAHRRDQLRFVEALSGISPR